MLLGLEEGRVVLVVGGVRGLRDRIHVCGAVDVTRFPERGSTCLFRESCHIWVGHSVFVPGRLFKVVVGQPAHSDLVVAVGVHRKR